MQYQIRCASSTHGDRAYSSLNTRTVANSRSPYIFIVLIRASWNVQPETPTLKRQKNASCIIRDSKICFTYYAFGNYFELLFQDMFPDVELVRSVQNELDEVIQDGIVNIVQLLR